VVEALQHGARVVCSDIPVFREIAGGACRYFDLRAASPAASLARAISVASREPHRIAEGLYRFSSAEVVTQYIALYSRLLAKRGVIADLPEPVLSAKAVGYDRYAT
jgi:glycosyltransferase involved in cell wall biosynthesis